MIQLDNTCRENKNNLIIRWAASLVGASTFSSVSLHFLRKGHTHEDIDQRFKIISTLISKQKLLETPYEFMDCICNGMTVPPSHRLVVRQMQPPFDYWQHYADAALYPRDVHNHTGPHAAHAFRLIKWQGTITTTTTTTTPGPPGTCSNGDVVLLVKHFMKDARAAQAPLTLIPCDACSSIPKGTPSLTSARAPMTSRDVQEYKKTIAKCRQPPWHLGLAALYLERWIKFLTPEPTVDDEAVGGGADQEPQAVQLPDPPTDDDQNFKWCFFRTARAYDHTLPELLTRADDSPVEDASLKFLVPADNFHPIFTSCATVASRAKQNAERARSTREAKAKPKQVRGNFGKAASKCKGRRAQGAASGSGEIEPDDEDAESEGAMDEG